MADCDIFDFKSLPFPYSKSQRSKLLEYKEQAIAKEKELFKKRQLNTRQLNLYVTNRLKEIEAKKIKREQLEKEFFVPQRPLSPADDEPITKHPMICKEYNEPKQKYQPMYQPLNTPVYHSPVEASVDQLPVDAHVRQSPVDTRVCQSPVDTRVRQSPVDTRVRQSPVDTRVCQSPVETHVRQSPVDTCVCQSPVDTRVHQSPVDTRVYQSPVDTHVRQSPVDTHVHQSPVDTHVHQSPVDHSRPIDTFVVYKPTVINSPVDQPVNAFVHQYPVDQSPVDTITVKDSKPIDSPARQVYKPPNNNPVYKLPNNNPVYKPPNNNSVYKLDNNPPDNNSMYNILVYQPLPVQHPVHNQPVRQSSMKEKLGGIIKGYLTRRLLRTEKVMEIVMTIKDAQKVLKSLIDPISSRDIELRERVTHQLQTARLSLHKIFFNLPAVQQMKYISHSRTIRLDKRFKQLTIKEERTKLPRLSSATMKSLERKQQLSSTTSLQPNNISVRSCSSKSSIEDSISQGFIFGTTATKKTSPTKGQHIDKSHSEGFIMPGESNNKGVKREASTTGNNIHIGSFTSKEPSDIRVGSYSSRGSSSINKYPNNKGSLKSSTSSKGYLGKAGSTSKVSSMKRGKGIVRNPTNNKGGTLMGSTSQGFMKKATHFSTASAEKNQSSQFKAGGKISAGVSSSSVGGTYTSRIPKLVSPHTTVTKGGGPKSFKKH